jgi:hypothetical protein
MVVRKPHWAVLCGLIVLGGGTAWLVSGRESIEEGRCRLIRRKVDLHHLNRLDNALLRLACQNLEPESPRPDDVKDLPDGFRQPRFYHVDTRGSRLPLVLDSARDRRLCVDLNRDGLLSGELCFQARSLESDRWGRRPWRFGPIFLGDGPSGGQGAAAFDAICYATDRPAPLSLYPAYYQSGRLRIDGRVCEVALVDGDYDGRFGSLVSLPAGQGAVADVLPEDTWRAPRCDLFAIDWNGDGKYEFSSAERSEVMPLSKMVLLGDRYYAIKVVPDGSELSLTPTEPAFGCLAIDPPNAELLLRLWSDAADQRISRSVGPWDLPVGAYRTLYAVVVLQDSKGDGWIFSTLRDTGKLGLFEIRPNETTRIRLGPPFVVKMDVHRVDARTLSICPIVVGCGGEQYRADFHHTSRAPERTFKIVDEKGNVLVADKFQFG